MTAPYRLHVTLQPGQIPRHPLLDVVAHQDERYALAGSKSALPIAQAIACLSAHYSLLDLRIEESCLESILKSMVQQ